MRITAHVPHAFQFLYRPSRYKVAYGGRGGAKSWGFADALLIQGVQQPGLRVLCCREFQNSMRDSVHKVLSDRIDALGLSSCYEIQNTIIKGPGGTEFIFEGIAGNAQKIKSYEGVDRCWVEEAQFVSKKSWDILIPTIRKEGSEIWVSFNPELETDETYVRFVLNPPPDCVTVKVGFSDNPWFPKVLEQERLHMLMTEPENYRNVWGGQCKPAVEGAVYAREMALLAEKGRVMSVPYQPGIPVHTFWDLGWADHTSIWFAQKVGLEFCLIDFLQDNRRSIDGYLKDLGEKDYLWGTDYLPHDAESRTVGTGMSVKEQLQAAGRTVEIIPRMSLTDGISAVRAVLPLCYFDKDRCADGLQALRRYRYEKSTTTNHFAREPVHDEFSHAADAFRYFALSIRRASASSGLGSSQRRRPRSAMAA